MALDSGADERGVVVVVLGLLVRPRPQQRLRYLGVARRAGDDERGVAAVVLGLLVRARHQ